MAQRSSLGTARLPIRRGFEPSRSQFRTLAFAFEQALPLVRKNAVDSHTSKTIAPSDLHVKSRSVASGAC
jgi:hypothetical protein